MALFVKKDCPVCSKFKTLFRERNIDFKAIELNTKSDTVESGYTLNGKEYPSYKMEVIPNIRYLENGEQDFYNVEKK